MLNAEAGILYDRDIARDYAELLPFVFKRFSILSAARTLLPTLWYCCRRPVLPPSDRPALFTMNIFPPMALLWYHLARKYLGTDVDIVIFDCSGHLDPGRFPGARVQKFLNLYAATKSEEFLRSIARHRSIGWICDDDMFFVGTGAADVVTRELAEERTASVSFRPRTWWTFDIDGKKIPPSSSYCIAFNRHILIERENLSLAPANGNTHPTVIGKPPKRYDTCDRANEILLRKGYRCFIVPEEERGKYVAGFSGMSGAVMLLSYFRTVDETLAYFAAPPENAWRGSMLSGALSALMAVHTIQELSGKIAGKPFPLPSLPPLLELEKIRQAHWQTISRKEHFESVWETSERLREAL
ncbi:MAG: hypothetical protein V1926_02755 [Candidatus Peregrinibacteria bacterium]